MITNQHDELNEMMLSYDTFGPMSVEDIQRLDDTLNSIRNILIPTDASERVMRQRRKMCEQITNSFLADIKTNKLICQQTFDDHMSVLGNITDAEISALRDAIIVTEREFLFGDDGLIPGTISRTEEALAASEESEQDLVSLICETIVDNMTTSACVTYDSLGTSCTVTINLRLNTPDGEKQLGEPISVGITFPTSTP